MAQGDTNSAKREAQEAYDKALLLRNMTQGSSDMFSDLLRRMEDFQRQRGARPAEIRAVRIRLLLNHCIVNALCLQFFTDKEQRRKPQIKKFSQLVKIIIRVSHR